MSYRSAKFPNSYPVRLNFHGMSLINKTINLDTLTQCAMKKGWSHFCYQALRLLMIQQKPNNKAMKFEVNGNVGNYGR